MSGGFFGILQHSPRCSGNVGKRKRILEAGFLVGGGEKEEEEGGNWRAVL